MSRDTFWFWGLLQIAAAHAAALAEDSNVYEYDGVYDQMHQAKKEPKMLEKQQRKPKYIAALVETAALRKKEQDVSFDRRTVSWHSGCDGAVKWKIFQRKLKFLTDIDMFLSRSRTGKRKTTYLETKRCL